CARSPIYYGNGAMDYW
nr:immunoglobulin heavy chain junction region [Mus musculus]NSM09485.1 immunoglobulin heavy chain junction region [Mus musculus]